MTRASFEYTIYVHATPEQVWQALIDPGLSGRYWFHANESDWAVGSPWTHRRTDDAGTVDIEGTVLEYDAPRRMVLTWQPPGVPAEATESSRVSIETFEENDWPHGPWTGLRLLHDDMEPEGPMHQSVREGWPAVLSGLKSVLERPEIFDAG